MSEDAHDSGTFTIRDWQNGKYCPQHGIPYCTPCLKILTVTNRLPALEQTYRPAMRNFFQNFFQDSRRRQFGTACQLAGANFSIVSWEFAIIGDDTSAHKADDDEMWAILTKEHLWDTSTPEWMKYDIPQLSEEDVMLLREFQLFKSGDDHGLRSKV